MGQSKQGLLLLAAGIAMAAGTAWADDSPSAGATAATTAAAPATQAAAKPAKSDSPTVTAMKAANALSDAGKYDEAIAAYEKIGVLKSKKMEAWRLNNEGLAYLKEDKADKAVPVLEGATTSDPANAIAWNNLGAAYEATNANDKAKEAYQKSIDAAKDAGSSSAKAEGNLAALNARLGIKDSDGGSATGKAPDDSGAATTK